MRKESLQKFREPLANQTYLSTSLFPLLLKISKSIMIIGEVLLMMLCAIVQLSMRCAWNSHSSIESGATMAKVFPSTPARDFSWPYFLLQSTIKTLWPSKRENYLMGDIMNGIWMTSMCSSTKGHTKMSKLRILWDRDSSRCQCLDFSNIHFDIK